MRNDNWSDEERYGEVKDFGQIVIDCEQDYELPCDKKLAGILGWDNVPTDDDAEAYLVLGIARVEGQVTSSPTLGTPCHK